MKRIHLIIITLLFSMLSVYAQENLDFMGKTGITSPEIHDNNTVTFRLKAPHATNVKVQGSWIPGQGYVQGTVDMIKATDGVWSYTTQVLPSELYSYSFIVDGLKMNDPNNVYSIRDVASVVNIFLIGGGQAELYKVNDVPHGTVARQWYSSPTLNMTRKMTIYTPPGYEQGKKSYPVLYLLHGVGGDEEAWMSLGRTSQILDNLIAQGKAEPMIVVMPNGHTSNTAAPGESSKGFYKPIMMTPDVSNGDMEKSFNDVISFVEDNYRVKKGKADRAVAGLSMGGFHSLYISANYTNTFDYIGLFSPAIMPPNNAASTIYQKLDEKLKIQKENAYKLYWIAIGKEDFLYKNVSDHRQKLDQMNFKYTYIESSGGHSWVNWRIYLSQFVPLLFKNN